MRSMTGFGRGLVERGDVRATVDIRTVNHRFLDLKLRAGQIPAALEDAIAGRIRGAMERGSVTVTVHLTGRAPGGLRIHGEAAARAHQLLSELAAQLAIAGPDLALVLAQPGVITTDEAVDEGGAALALAAVDAALVQLDAMRTTEGVALASELRLRIDELAAARAQIAGLAASVTQQVARRLRDRVKRLSEEAGVAGELDEARLAQEVALLADRADITEELVRLASHLDQARALLDASGAVGRRLDFLVQEIGRELNTIGAKSTSVEITTAVVAGKATLEKIREQVQNVE
ncbi:MAG TPA: YicC/YloC family endoribonuclease [Kofleriaceae bacterium]|nr:YicC/YloC family endoribonuclease [Kofleriaceae bacterium]